MHSFWNDVCPPKGSVRRWDVERVVVQDGLLPLAGASLNLLPMRTAASQFFMSETLVTNMIVRQLVGPMETIPFTEGIRIFLPFRLSQAPGLDWLHVFLTECSARSGHQVRLPTESEWENVAIEVQKSLFVLGDDHFEVTKHGLHVTLQGLRETFQVPADHFQFRGIFGDLWQICIRDDADPSAPFHEQVVLVGGCHENPFPLVQADARRQFRSVDPSLVGFRVAMDFP